QVRRLARETAADNIAGSDQPSVAESDADAHSRSASRTARAFTCSIGHVRPAASLHECARACDNGEHAVGERVSISRCREPGLAKKAPDGCEAQQGIDLSQGSRL